MRSLSALADIRAPSRVPSAQHDPQVLFPGTTSCSFSHAFGLQAFDHSNSTSVEAAFLEECHGVEGVARAAMIPLIARLLTLLASAGLNVSNLSQVQPFLVGPCARTH